MTFSNYGVASVWLSVDGGQNWMNKEGNLSNSTKNGYADLNGDGKKDLLVTPAEGAEVYLAWYDLPENPRTQPWAKHIIENNASMGVRK